MANPDIKEYRPGSGQVLKNNSQVLNIADYVEAERQASVEQASRDGTLYRGWFQGMVPAGTTSYFVLRPPPGLLVYGESRTQAIEAGEVRSQFLVGGTLGAPVGAPLPTRNFDVVAGAPAQCVLQQYDGVTGAVPHSPIQLLAAPTTGPGVRPSAQTDAGAHVRISNDAFAVFTLANDTGANENVTLFLTWQELP